MNQREFIEVIEASQNNLKKISVSLPVGAMTVITGVSGSGKSSLAFDTLYAEGQRRYIESLSSYARQFLERIPKPAVKEIRGISPAVAIRQKTISRNPRSTVATVTEIYDFLRLLFSRVGVLYCRKCGKEVRHDTVDQVVEELLERHAGARAVLSFPLRNSALDLSEAGTNRSVGTEEIQENLLKQGFRRLLPPPLGKVRPVTLPAKLPEDREELLAWHVLVDRLVLEAAARDRLVDSLEMTFAEGRGTALVTILRDEVEEPVTLRFSERFECQDCGITYRAPEPHFFSFNSPYGACPTCHGFGSTITIDKGLVIPDPGKSLAEGAVEPFTKPRYRRFQQKLLRWAEEIGLPVDIPYRDLGPAAQRAIWFGSEDFPGVVGFFDYLATKKYKMHVRIFMARYRGYTTCPDCEGSRLREEARLVRIAGRSIADVVALTIAEASEFFGALRLNREQQVIAARVLEEIQRRLSFLLEVGLGYLTLDRLTSTLSGGEMQRIHLAASLGAGLTGTLYVLDEPSIGLHPRDQDRLVRILKRLRDLGNTIVVVEHEREIIREADHIIDIGPRAGAFGGEVVFSGTYRELLESPDSLTARYLRGDDKISVPALRRPVRREKLVIRGATHHNLKNIDVEIPLGLLVCITGVSGSGKSSLVEEVLYAGLMRLKGQWTGPVGTHRAIEGAELVSDVILVDQSPIGRTPRSNPATYVKVYDEIRKLFAAQRQAQVLGLTPGHFSFNVAGGRCETCQGAGTVTVEMQFLADVELPCEDCGGTRFQPHVLEVRYKGLNIAEVLRLTVAEALEHFAGQPKITRKLKILREVGLDYLQLGQSATTLSGGEAQRIKLAAYLSQRTKGRALFILDEPTTGLHFDDIAKLLQALERLLASGATIVMVEHNLDVIKCADWVIDLGPEGGEGGGYIVAAGPPELVATEPRSHTGRFLRELLDSSCVSSGERA
ncbi:MAG: excinuclease ABC subunit UvrA [Acidobacteriota bacterium]